MLPIPSKVTGDTYTATEFTSFLTDVQSMILSTGQVLSGLDQTQTSKGASIYSAAGTFYTDSGAANAYVLSPQGSLQTPISYDNGMEIRFTPSAINTAASTVNVNGLGDKPLFTQEGNEIPGGQLRTGITHIANFDTAADGFKLIDRYAPMGGQTGFLSLVATVNDVFVDPVTVRDSTNTLDIILRTVFVKDLAESFLAGSGVGGRATGVPLTANTAYNVFLVYNANTGAVDMGFDTDIDAANLLLSGATFTHFRRIWSIHTEPGSTDIIPFTKCGNYCYFNRQNTQIASGTATGVSTFTLAVTPVAVPELPDLIGIFGLNLFEGGSGSTITPTRVFLTGFGFVNNASKIGVMKRNANDISVAAPFLIPIGLNGGVPEMTLEMTGTNIDVDFDLLQIGWVDNRDIF